MQVLVLENLYIDLVLLGNVCLSLQVLEFLSFLGQLFLLELESIETRLDLLELRCFPLGPELVLLDLPILLIFQLLLRLLQLELFLLILHILQLVELGFLLGSNLRINLGLSCNSRLPLCLNRCRRRIHNHLRAWARLNLRNHHLAILLRKLNRSLIVLGSLSIAGRLGEF